MERIHHLRKLILTPLRNRLLLQNVENLAFCNRASRLSPRDAESDTRSVIAFMESWETMTPEDERFCETFERRIGELEKEDDEESPVDDSSEVEEEL